MANLTNVTNLSLKGFSLIFSNSFQNVTARSAAGTDSSLLEGIYLVFNKIAEVITNTYVDYGFWEFVVVCLAILGLVSIVSAIFSKACDAVGIFIKIFVLIPAIIVVNLINKKKRQKRLEAWGEFKRDLKKSKKRVSKKMWIFWIIIKILIPILIVMYILWGVF